jgi:hypothetical protein
MNPPLPPPFPWQPPPHPSWPPLSPPPPSLFPPFLPLPFFRPRRPSCPLLLTRTCFEGGWGGSSTTTLSTIMIFKPCKSIVKMRGEEEERVLRGRKGVGWRAANIKWWASALSRKQRVLRNALVCPARGIFQAYQTCRGAPREASSFSPSVRSAGRRCCRVRNSIGDRSAPAPRLYNPSLCDFLRGSLLELAILCPAICLSQCCGCGCMARGGATR